MKKRILLAFGIVAGIYSFETISRAGRYASAMIVSKDHNCKLVSAGDTIPDEYRSAFFILHSVHDVHFFAQKRIDSLRAKKL